MLSRLVVTVLIIIGLAWMGGFEYLRENARRPYIIHGYMYSNSILVSDVDRLNEEGYLASAKWTGTGELTEENMLDAGRALFRNQCMICHTMGGARDIVFRTSKLKSVIQLKKALVILMVLSSSPLIRPCFIQNRSRYNLTNQTVISTHIPYSPLRQKI